MSAEKPVKVFAGRYEYRGKVILRTSWEGEGPRGGTKYTWEIGTYVEERGGRTPVLSGSEFFGTLREAVKYLDDKG